MYVLPPCHTGTNYTALLENHLPVVFVVVPLMIRQTMCLIHDRGPVHCTLAARQFLNRVIYLIVGYVEVNWLHYYLRSSRKNPLEFYLWKHLKPVLYAFPFLSVESLCERILAG
jgi:hypothetical protein